MSFIHLLRDGLIKNVKLLKVIGILIGSAAISFGLLLILIIYGEPIHDLNAWMLEKNFYAKNITHPVDSVLLKKIIYLGGISTHGDLSCVYAVGEWRYSSLSREKIKETYRDEEVNLWSEEISIKVMFADGYEGPHTLPYAYWQDDLRDTITDKNVHYIVYASTQWPIFLLDFRCDD
jgi:hypothetical protein